MGFKDIIIRIQNRLPDNAGDYLENLTD